MSRGRNLQEMEVGTKQSRTAVNAGAKAGDSMQKLAPGAVAGQTGGWEDLGGPTPDNYRPDDDSSKLKESGLKSVSNVVNKGAKAADAMKGLKKTDAVKEEEDLDDEEYIEEEEVSDDEEVISEAEHEDDEEEEDDKKKSKKSSSKSNKEDEDEDEDEDEEVKEEFDIEEDVNALLEGEDLSEEFQEKARIIFESALRSKVNDIKEALIEQYEEAYENRLVEEVAEISAALQERVDAYLEYVSEEWMTENQLSVEKGLKEELTESFLSGLKGLFEEHYVEIPEEKYDVLESMVDKLDEMETKLNEQIEKNVSLNKRLSESVADRIFEEISGGLATTQKEKLASLAESVEFESEQEYREKLETLRESYFPTKYAAPTAQPETLSEGVVSSVEDHSPSMNTYMKALSMLAKN